MKCATVLEALVVTVVLSQTCVFAVYVPPAALNGERQQDAGAVRYEQRESQGRKAKRPSKIYRLPTSLTPEHYELQFLPDIYKSDPANFSLAGKVIIRVLCRKRTSVVELHAVGLQLSGDSMRVTPDGDDSVSAANVKKWELNTERETLSLSLDRPLKAGYRYLIHMSFRAPLTEKFQAAFYSSYEENGHTKYLAATIFVPAYARMAFPCFDEPALKASFSVILVRKPDFVALSNMPRSSTNTSRRREGGREELWAVDEFQTSPPMSTYLLTFTVCQFLSQQANTTRGYTFKAWSRPESVQQTTFALDVGVKVMPFFDDYFGIKFPLPEQEMIALPEFQYGGMEHWGLVGYKENKLLYSYDLPSIVDKQTIARVISHELGHMWFGDLLTMKWWDDLWLKEGFATYVMDLGIDFIFPKWKMMEQFPVRSFRTAMQLDVFHRTRPLYRPITSNVRDAYDKIIYYKGASVLHMVKNFLGESTFRRGIQNYLRKFQYGSATHEDLWKVLSQEAKADRLQVNVSEVMRSWTVQNNFPVVMVTRLAPGKMNVTQQRFLLKATSSDKKYTWDIPFTYASQRTHTAQDPDVLPNDVIWISRHDRETTIDNPEIPGPEEADGWLLGNVGCYGFYRVNYEESNWQALIRQLNTDHSKINVANRAQILMDSFSLARAGQLSYRTALSTLGYLQKETCYVPWKAALKELADLKALLSANLFVRPQLATFMQRQTSSIFGNFRPRRRLQERLDSWTPMLVAQAACSYELPACVNMSRAFFTRWLAKPNNNRIPVDLRSQFYCSAMAYGDGREWNVVFQRFQQEANANEKARLRLALACSRDRAILNTLINMTLDPSYIRTQDALSTLVACSANPDGRDLVWAFVRDNLPVIKDRLGSTAFNMNYLFSGISESFHTVKHLKKLKALAAKYPDVKKAMKVAMEKTRANRKWVTTNMATIRQWLTEQNQMSG